LLSAIRKPPFFLPALYNVLMHSAAAAAAAAGMCVCWWWLVAANGADSIIDHQSQSHCHIVTVSQRVRTAGENFIDSTRVNNNRRPIEEE
jgi:hypothetical protein